MTDIIVAVVIAAIIALAVLYIVKEKKKGSACVGCPHAGTCLHRAAAAAAGRETDCGGHGCHADTKDA